jgi:hypothetical protein
MIKDNSILTEIKMEWQGVEKLRDSLSLDAMVSFAMPTLGGHYPFKLAKAAQNLPFIHACAVLNVVLETLSTEGQFASKSRFLGALVNASKTSLPWVDYSLIKKAVKERNDVAHNGYLVEKEECLNYIAAIRAELVNWAIIT